MYDDDWGVFWAIEKVCFICIHSAAADAAALCVVTVVVTLVTYVETVCGFTAEYLDLLDINRHLLHAAAWRTSMHLYITAMYFCCFCCCCSAVCCHTAVACDGQPDELPGHHCWGTPQKHWPQFQLTGFSTLIPFQAWPHQHARTPSPYPRESITTWMPAYP